MDREFKVEQVTAEVKETVQMLLPKILEDARNNSSSLGNNDTVTLSPDLSSRVRGALRQLSVGLVERDAEVRLLLLATLCGEHLLLIGPPGTAKSELSRRLGTICEGEYFERLLTRFSVPEELFGPLSMKGLEEDRYERQTTGYLPQATVAFIDEIFKANSAILNALLAILNERVFDNGNQRYEVPLVCLVGASNELPESEELDALYDRFLFRREVSQVSGAGLGELLSLAGQIGTVDEWSYDEALEDSQEDRISVQEMREVLTSALQTTLVPSDIIELLTDLRTFLQESCEPPIYVSDRRLIKIVTMLRVMAYTNGRRAVNVYDCLMLQHTMWQRPEEADIIQSWVLERAAQDKGTDQVSYLLSGVFRRACHAQKDDGPDMDACLALKKETEQLREVLVQQLIELEESKDGAIPILRDHLWLSKSDIKRTSQTLAPMLKKARLSLERLLDDALTLEVALEKGPEPYMLALLLPEYWKPFIRNGPIKEVAPLGIQQAP
eukprot:CAMPEP_0196585576 /NCGR_PEP_ID=MMETSP1081-20130531/51182_1 /TAXON_ID=36882 /ORGANISM="Pyramimonas amylifera, Strain CCMP720" /LENGTH=497 /DNA_ID=CAMNT_0041907171 /DNA_START=285 /DNA_END=1778 /DNA_ORIENTATION=+